MKKRGHCRDLRWKLCGSTLDRRHSPHLPWFEDGVAQRFHVQPLYQGGILLGLDDGDESVNRRVACNPIEAAHGRANTAVTQTRDDFAPNILSGIVLPPIIPANAKDEGSIG
jgi:hypothetical protein